MLLNNINVDTISNLTGTAAPSAGPNGILGPIALQNVVNGQISSISAAFGNVQVSLYDSKNNIKIGNHSFSSNISGTDNIAIGDYSLSKNTSGSNNISFGKYNLKNSIYGNDVISIGSISLSSSLNTPDGTIVIGNSLSKFKGHSDNYYQTQTIMGNNCLDNYIGTSTNENYLNIAIGDYSLHSITGQKSSGSFGNVAIGYGALSDTVDADRCIAIGGDSGYNYGHYNITVGYVAGATSGSYNIIHGIFSGTSGNDNIIIGNSACAGGNNGFENAARNISIGNSSLFKNFKSSDNIAIGDNALRSITGGNYNIAIGSKSLYTNNTGSYNIGIGYNVDINSNISNCGILGNNITGNTNNMFYIGGYSTYKIDAASWTYNSDRRIKDEIETSPLGLEFINKLRPVKFKYKKFDNATDENDIKYTKPHYGLIAQELKDVIDELGVEFGGYIDPSYSGAPSGSTLGIGYTELIAPLIKAVQEQQIIINELKDKNDKLENRLSFIESYIASISGRI